MPLWIPDRRTLATVALAGLSMLSATVSANEGSAELRQRALDRFHDTDCVDALALMRQVESAYPNDAVVFETIAACEMVQSHTATNDADRLAAQERERAAALRAQALGDNSPLLQLLLDELRNPSASVPLDASMAAAERAFSRGDLDEALRLYEEIAATHPNDYESRLFAGDVYFRRNDVAAAAQWFDAAIAVDPNRETAYRYAGDALDAAGETDAALDHYLNAVIAEPYSKMPWMGLKQWAQRHHVTLRRPHIPALAAPTTTAKGKAVQLTVNADGDPALMAAQISYGVQRATYRDTQFRADHPNETTYRHSLGEESLALGSIILLDSPSDTPSPFADLKRLNDADVLEAYVLLSAADEGIAKDYPAYRAAHRDRLNAYLREFIVRPRP